MIDANVPHNREYIGGSCLQWENRVDAHGSRIEWCIVTDNAGWACSYGPVHNDGILFGSRAISNPAGEKILLTELRNRIEALNPDRKILRQNKAA